MKKYTITVSTNILAIARQIIADLEAHHGTEIWHPDWVWSGNNIAAMSEDEYDELIRHDPPVTGWRITSSNNQWSGRNLFHHSVFPSTQSFPVDLPLEFYVALFLKRNIPAYPAILEVGVDFDTILGGMEIPKPEYRRRRDTTTRVQRVGGTTK